MKIILALVFLSSSVAFAAPKTLKQQVEKMGTCSGQNGIYGYELTFTKEKKEVRGEKAQMLGMTIPADAYNADEYTTNDEYAYTVSEEEGASPTAAYTPWKVQGKKVLVYVKGDWMSLTIGFKSKTCWF